MIENQINIPLTTIKGIGPKKSQLYKRLGIYTVADALYSFPRDYEDRRNVKAIAYLENGEEAMVKAKLTAIRKSRYIKGRKRTLRLLIRDATGAAEALFFNASYLERTLKVGEEYWFYGKVNMEKGGLIFIHPEFKKVYDDSNQDKILPIYPLISGVSQNDRRKLAALALEFVDSSLEYLGEETRRINELCGIEYALNSIHFPEDERKMRVAKYRLIFEELLLFSLGLILMKNRFEQNNSSYKLEKIPYEKELCDSLPYKLTEGQRNAIAQICDDMESGRRMNRLIQGDVGSGKTVVSAAAIYKVIKSGYQAVLMAPTEILANQHFETFTELFKESGIRISLLTSSLGAKKRREILSECREGKADLIIGTHAVFSKDVEFSNLALVVTDEQHRFGVSQREALNSKGNCPHIMVMTATPIPRTLALILYGDMDVSVILDKPSGRKEIITKAYDAIDRNKVYELVRNELNKGRQAYIVTPLIEASEALDVRSTEEAFEEASSFFAPFRTEMLHGKLKQAEKERIMEEFKNGEIQVLVSTVIIEVGINVPNASVMVLENAERFGLAQMHQLRGRVGRGSNQSYCLLVVDNKTEVAKKRAEVMEETSDGFELAEKDLILRGTGEFFGSRQHGIPEMRLADVIRHSKVLNKAVIEAQRIIQEDRLLEAKKNESLKQRIFELYGELNPSL